MIATIINSFDIWTDAQGIKSRIKINSVENISLEGIARLRELILELAVLGKLVPQDPNDEPASVLLKMIEKEREGSSAFKKRKKEEKPYIGQIFNSKISGWELCKLEDIGDTNIGLTYSPNDVSVNGTIVLRSSNIQNGEIELSDLVRVNKKINENVLVKQGDLLICARNGSKKLVGKCALIRSLPEPMAFGAFMAIFRSPFNEYCRLFIESPIYRRNLEGVTTTTINQITQDNLKNTYIPLPPFAEQHRIVAKVDELMTLCDKLEEVQFNKLKTHQVLVKTLLETLTQTGDTNELQAAWKRMSTHFDTLFCTEDSIDQLKQTILQLAVMGKLVKQEPNDAPASELVQRIKKEKEKAQDKSQAKADNWIANKTNLSIEESELPFSLPKSWLWCKLGDVCNRIIDGNYGGQYPSPEEFLEKGVPFLTSAAIGLNDNILISELKYISVKKHAELLKAHCTVGDLLITNRGGRVGAIAILNDHLFLDCNIGPQVTRIAPNHLIVSKEYMLISMKSPFFQTEFKYSNSGSAMNFVNLTKTVNAKISLPPSNEQKRIVAKVNELFSLCDSLKGRIIKTQEINILLSKTIVGKSVQ